MDIFGTALLQHYRAPSEAMITITRDDGWQDTHSPALYFTPEPFDFEQPALEQVTGRVLDVGCGAGRHLKWFAARGQEAFGIDLSPGAVRTCQEQGIEGVALFDIMRSDPAALSFQPDSITLFGNNVGIGGNFEGSQRLLKILAGICAPGGLLVLTGLNVRETENPQHIAYHARNTAAGRRRGELKLEMSYDGQTGPGFDWYHPEPHEVEEMAAQSGWQVEQMEEMGAFFWAALRRS